MNDRTPLFNFTTDERREYESATLRFTVVAQIQNYLDHAGLQAKDLAQRIHKSRPWVSKLLSGRQNATLNTLADIGVALGTRWEIELVPAERAGTPAEQDPPPLEWATSNSVVYFTGNSFTVTETPFSTAHGLAYSDWSVRDLGVSVELDRIRIIEAYFNSSPNISHWYGCNRVMSPAKFISPGNSKVSTVTASGYLQFTGEEE